MNYAFTPLIPEITVEAIISVHYFEYPHDFYFSGEAHDFWEFLFVDKGEVEVSCGSQVHQLKKGDIIFHKPMEFHRLCANGANAPNLVVSGFVCNSPAMRFFEDRILRVSDTERNLMAQLIREARSAFSTPLDDPFLKQLEFRENIPFAAAQMVKTSLELLLIQFIRNGQTTGAKTTSSIREAADADLLERVTAYLERHVRETLTLEEVCRDNFIGRSSLQKLFRQKTGGGVMEYFSHLKVETAKQYIRDGRRNFTEIAHELGFSSIHYFSRRFKLTTGMTPTEYASSVKIREEQE